MGAVKGALGLFGGTLRDLAPIVLIVAFFQIVVIRQPVENLTEIAIGFVFVLIGLAIFIRGLEMALFPIGEALATAFVLVDEIQARQPGSSPAARARSSHAALPAAMGVDAAA